MRINAYVMAADPAWVEQSIRSYYDLVDRIVVSYDPSNRGWTGAPIQALETVERIKAVDHDNKCTYVPGSFYVPGRPPLASDTVQRQTALDIAGTDSEWVLQLDTDELVVDPAALRDSLRRADEDQFEAVHFPARRVVQHVRGDWFVEDARRLWRFTSNYPGPVLVRSGSRLLMCRQGPQSIYRVDVSRRNTDPFHPSDAPVHLVIRKNQAIVHLSWVRSDEHMDAKLSSWGHARERAWAQDVANWKSARDHPIRSILDPRKRVYDRWMRPVRLKGLLTAEERRSNGLLT